MWRVFSLKELQSATNNFNYDNKLGEGGSGSVYWGQLWDGSQIAVKRLKVWSDKAEVEFSVEVEMLAHVQHKNLLNVRGYCAEGQERLIVCDYMPNLSLLSHLHGHHSSESLLDWQRRMNIAIGSAEGIAYLHHHARPPIVHDDIKASNVLLDSGFCPKVADFGFSKLIPETQEKEVSESWDVYSFGILLLELISGRRPVEKVSQTPIVDWALSLAREGKFREIADPRLNGEFVDEEVKRVVYIALVCADNLPEKRPTMLEVVDFLKGQSHKFSAIEIDEMFTIP